MQTPILGQSYVARSVNAADSRMVNLFPEATPQAGKTAGFLNRAPGLRLLEPLGTGPIRGLWSPDPTGLYAYVISGNAFYRIDTSYNVENYGYVSGTGQVSMADNGTQLFIASNPDGYIFNMTTLIFAPITDPDFPGAVTVGYLDGYFVFNEPNSQRVWTTVLLDGSSVDPLDFASAEGSPDGLVSLIIDHREAWLFGTNSVEVWYDAGNAGFPLTRIQGAYNEIGCVAAYSVAKLDNGVFWLGGDARGEGIVYRTNGYTGQRVSTHAIEWQIQQYGDISDAIGYTYQQDGHAFYVLIFPSAGATWVYDVATDNWHERAAWVNGAYTRHRSNCQMAFNIKLSSVIIMMDAFMRLIWKRTLTMTNRSVGFVHGGLCPKTRTRLSVQPSTAFSLMLKQASGLTAVRAISRKPCFVGRTMAGILGQMSIGRQWVLSVLTALAHSGVGWA